jgi:hypothetical protein
MDIMQIYLGAGMSKRTFYGKNYRPDVCPRPRVGVDPCPRVRADARGHASRGQWIARTRLSVRGDAALGGSIN